MSDESNPPLKLLLPLSDDLLQIVRLIGRAANTFDIPFLLAGAAARDTVLVHLWGMHEAGRATIDVDFAFSVRDWTQFHRLRDALIATDSFQKVRHQEQRLAYSDPADGHYVPVDLVPFHGVVQAEQKIAWPPEGDFVMNVAGFEEALASSLLVEAEPNLTLRVTSIPGLILLKLIAWLDRGAVNNKDAADIFTLLKTYASAGNEDRLYDREHELLEATGYNLIFAGASLLGRDAAQIAGNETTEQVREILTSERDMDRLLSQIAGGTTFPERTQTADDILRHFRIGFLGFRESKTFGSPLKPIA